MQEISILDFFHSFPCRLLFSVTVSVSGRGVTSLAHCDGCDTERAITEMVDTVTEMSKGGPPGRLVLLSGNTY